LLLNQPQLCIRLSLVITLAIQFTSHVAHKISFRLVYPIKFGPKVIISALSHLLSQIILHMLLTQK